MKSDAKIFLRLGVISGSVVAADQITKSLVTKFLAVYETVPVITGLFNITHVLNPGGAFGLFAQHSAEVRQFFFLFVSTLVAGLILWFYKQTARTHLVLSSALACIFGGAVGNLIDRFRLGKVVDFLDFYIAAWHWPAFNIADSAICVGMAIFIYYVVVKQVEL
ncbi:MAG TPA: signal peptidase II [Desulfobacteraceae bacterium]|nr:signal peptidase II [Desulfobacteraceae bacterium]